jgi:hypothetical protein
MQDQPALKDYLHKLGGYYLIPHELLHVLAYRIIGKPCHYEWGAYRVQSLSPKTRREKLFVLLLPFVVCWLLGLLLYITWVILAVSTRMAPEAYFTTGPKWHLLFPLLATLCIIYSGTAHQDLIDAYGWLFKYETHHEPSDPDQQPQE